MRGELRCFESIVIILLILSSVSDTSSWIVKVDANLRGEGVPEIAGDKNVDRTTVFLDDVVTVTINVEGVGTPVTEPDEIITHPADLVIMMDASGSYGGEIEDMKAKFSSLLSDLEAAGLDINVGFIVFGNFYSFGECPINTDGSVNAESVRQLTSNTISIVSFIDTLNAEGVWEPWGDAIWLGNNWMSWRPEAYRIVVLATDEPCDEGRRVPGPLERVIGIDYNGSALWSQVSFAASLGIKYITIQSDERELCELQMKAIAQLTGGLYYNLSHAQAEDFVSVINDTITEVVKGEQRETAGYDVVVSDTVSSEVEILPDSFNTPPTTQTSNPDGSVMLSWNLGDIKCEETAELSYQIRMITLGDIQVSVDAEVNYLDWEGNSASLQLSLPIVTVVRAHDIAVIDIRSQKTIVGLGHNLSVDLIVTNPGGFPETFNVTLYANTTAVENHTVVSIQNGTWTTLDFSWDTTGFTYGNYTLSAFAWPVTFEVDLSDNSIIGEIILISIPGDVDGDKDVDIFDIVAIASAYGSDEGDPAYNPNYDIDGDGDIDIFDIVAAASHYGESW